MINKYRHLLKNKDQLKRKQNNKKIKKLQAICVKLNYTETPTTISSY